MKTGQNGQKLIKEFEGLGPEFKKTGKIQAYICPSGKPTIGWGHTATVKMADVKNKKQITEEEAQRLFESDLKRFENYINLVVKVPLTQNRFDALVSLTYNIGTGAFGMSTLLKKLNEGKYKEIPQQIIRWTKGGKPLQVLPGLLKRRNREIQLWEKP